MQRVLDVQKIWDEREKSRQLALRPMRRFQQPIAPYIPPPAQPVVKNYSFKETSNDKEISDKFMNRVKDKVEAKRNQLEEDVTNTVNEINKLKVTKKEEKENIIISILRLLKRKDEGLIKVEYL
jgi:hypothetical protein